MCLLHVWFGMRQSISFLQDIFILNQYFFFLEILFHIKLNYFLFAAIHIDVNPKVLQTKMMKQVKWHYNEETKYWKNKYKHALAVLKPHSIARWDVNENSEQGSKTPNAEVCLNQPYWDWRRRNGCNEGRPWEKLENLTR